MLKDNCTIKISKSILPFVCYIHGFSCRSRFTGDTRRWRLALWTTFSILCAHLQASFRRVRKDSTCESCFCEPYSLSKFQGFFRLLTIVTLDDFEDCSIFCVCHELTQTAQCKCCWASWGLRIICFSSLSCLAGWHGFPCLMASHQLMSRTQQLICSLLVLLLVASGQRCASWCLQGEKEGLHGFTSQSRGENVFFHSSSKVLSNFI